MSKHVPMKKRSPSKIETWAVVVLCRSRKHAREAYQNIDNGLRKLHIARLVDENTYTIKP